MWMWSNIAKHLREIECKVSEKTDTTTTEVFAFLIIENKVQNLIGVISEKMFNGVTHRSLKDRAKKIHAGGGKTFDAQIMFLEHNLDDVLSVIKVAGTEDDLAKGGDDVRPEVGVHILPDEAEQEAAAKAGRRVVQVGGEVSLGVQVSHEAHHRPREGHLIIT